MNILAYKFVVLTSIGAALLLAAQPWADFLQFSYADLGGISAFVVLGLLAEVLALDFAVGSSRKVKSSITFLPLFACALVFPPPVAVAAAAIVMGFTEVVLRDLVVWRASFNISQYVLTYGASAHIYWALKGLFYSGSSAIDPVAFLVLAVTFFLLNTLLVSTFFSLRQRRNVAKIIQQAVGSRGGNLWFDLLASPIAIIAALLYFEFYVAGLLLVSLPLLLIRYSYISKVQLQAANRDLLRVLIKAIETRDPYTSGHSVRVSTLARYIADDLGVSRRTAEKIETAALLHDIGKIDAAYAPIIDKPAPLDNKERSIIRTHATKGAELLKTLSSVEDDVIQGVRHHHEQYNGTGYPDQLAGKDIPLPARIIALCDAIDAMLSGRPYRPPLNTDDVRTELVRCSGHQFDPDIVETILRHQTLERAHSLLERPEPDQEMVAAIQPG